mgnify:CR=1 FL=1
MIDAPFDGIDVTRPHRCKVVDLNLLAAREALVDARVNLRTVDRSRFGCAISAHMGDTGYIENQFGLDHRPEPNALNWWDQYFPSTACSVVTAAFGLYGPTFSHSVACASGLVDILAAVRALRDGQCDIALAGSSEAFHPLFCAGFRKMKALAEPSDIDDPRQACRPFDRHRRGFVMGEGGAVFVVERLSHAVNRGAPIYAEVVDGKLVAEAHHVTGISADSEALEYSIAATLKRAKVEPKKIGYISAHGTGTVQNDVAEALGIRRALGAAADSVCVSSIKSMVGHLVNASGSVELAITALALRDGYAPPTINLTDPDPECRLDCLPLVGRMKRLEYALKTSLAFGGHTGTILLRRWDKARGGFAQQARPVRQPSRYPYQAA